MSEAPDLPISRFPVPALEELPPDLREKVEEVAAKTGFVPNVYLALAHRPDEWRAFFAYHQALMEREGGLSKADRELIVVATSGANQCPYCVVAHGAVARIRTKNPRIADQVAIHHQSAELTERQKLMLDFALKLAVAPAELEDGDLETLREEGFSNEEIWDIGAITSLFAMSNRLAHLAAMRPNPEFYLMGRVPKGG